MQIAVVGAGAIGGVVGAYLARNGTDITLVDKDEAHVQVMKDSGLTIETLDGMFTVPVQAVTVQEFSAAPSTVDVVLLAVKAQHTKEAVQALAHKLHDASFVVSLQNGLCENVIADSIGSQRTMGAFVNLFSDYIKPGYIQYGGVGSMYLGELNGQLTSRLRTLHELLQQWGDARITENIFGYLWSKLAYGAILTATALVDEAMADVIDPAENRELMFAIASEVLAVADRLHIQPMPFDDWEPALVYPESTRDTVALNEQWDKLIARLRSYKKVKSGIWRDLVVRHRKTEVPHHLNPVIGVGESFKVPMPLTNKLVEMIRALEEGERTMSWDNIAELISLQNAVC
jgi:2-dehydropantoate 2-reductase